MIQTLAHRLSVPVDRVRRLGLFIGLAVVMISAHALARTVAEAVFLANPGPEALPLYFVLVGIGAVPIAAGATRIIDRMPRTALYAASQLAMALVVVGIRLLITTGATPVYYVALIGIVVIEMLMNIQFWVLVSDYFTSLEQKKIVPFLTIGIAAGGMLGGSLANLLSRFLTPPDVLLAFPLLYGLGYVVFGVIRRTQTALQMDEPAVEERRGALAELWALVRGYPIVVLLALVGFLEVMLGGLGSYLSYTIYTDSFPTERELTAFLGTLRAVLSVLQGVVIFFVTRPLVHRMGVGRMNLIYPSTSVAALGALALIPGLPTAILAHANFSTVAVGVAGPVENLTYNAVPPRFLGRVRTVSEAMLQPTGLAAGGVLLALVQDRLAYRQIALVVLGVAVVMLVLGALRSRAYLRALQAQLRDRSLDLSRDDEYLSRLHGRYADEVHDLIASSDPHVRSVGIELATRIDPDRYLDDVIASLPDLDDRSRAAAVALMQRVRQRSGRQAIADLLASDAPHVRPAALEGLIAQRGLPHGVRFEELLRDEDPGVRGLAVALAYREGHTDEGRAVLAELDGRGLEHAVRGVRALPSEEAMPILAAALQRGLAAGTSGALDRRSPAAAGAGDRGAAATSATADRASATAAADALEALRELSVDPEGGLRERVVRLTGHEAEEVRAAAYALLARHNVELDRVAEGLGDPQVTVRNTVATALGDVGDAALPRLRAALASDDSAVTRAAITALGRMRTARSASMAFDALQRDYRRADLCTTWLQRIPRDDPDWAPLTVALEDSNRRAVNSVLDVLEAFGHETTLRHARLALASRDERLRANAVETLASLPDRKFVLPVMDLFEALATKAKVDGAVGERGARDAAPLEELLEIHDRWVRAGAAGTLRNLGRPVPEGAGEEVPMSRLLFLKGVSLFRELSLDSLLALDQALRQADLLPGEVVFREGSTGDDLYIVLRGSVVVEKGHGEAARELARMGPGDFFGEMALFDDEPRSATCRAETETTLLRLDRSRFHSLMEQLPRLGIEISRVLSLRLRRTSGTLQRSGADAP